MSEHPIAARNPRAGKPRTELLHDLTGQTFNAFTAVSYAGKSKWLCRCACGNERIVHQHSLRTGRRRSCGCVQPSKPVGTPRTPGKTNLRAYRSWYAMIDRCENPKNDTYPRYGAKGITVCERWHDLDSFLADMGECPPGMTIDRYPNQTGNYEPGNCRWATQTQQQRNRTNNTLLTLNGQTRCISEWAEALGLSERLIQKRKARGRSDEEALAPKSPTPPQRLTLGEEHRNSKLTAQEVVKIREMAEAGTPHTEIGRRFGVSGQNVRDIVRRKLWRHV